MDMTPESIFEYIRDVLIEEFELEADRITLDAKLRDDLDIDSIDAVDLMIKLKPLVGQRLKPDAFRTVRTIGDVVNAVHSMLHADA